MVLVVQSISCTQSQSRVAAQPLHPISSPRRFWKASSNVMIRPSIRAVAFFVLLSHPISQAFIPASNSQSILLSSPHVFRQQSLLAKEFDLNSHRGNNDDEKIPRCCQPPLRPGSHPAANRVGRNRILTVTSFALATCFLLSPIQPSNAAGYGSLTPEQKFVAEAWRTVDATFLDRTFNGQDWFQVRQDLVKRRYQSMDEAQTAVADMMSTLGDKYTKVRRVHKRAASVFDPYGATKSRV